MRKCIKCNIEKEESDFVWSVTNKSYKTCSDCKDYIHEMERSIPAGVYCIKDTDTDEVLYIGQSYIPYRRRKEHLSVYKSWGSVKHKSLLTQAIFKGELDRNKLSFEMLEHIEDEIKRDVSERKYIEHYSPKYNKDKPNKNIKKWILEN